MTTETRGRIVIVVTLAGFALFVALSVAIVQSLIRARVGVLATLRAPAGETVALTVALPRGYGLSGAERRDGWDEVNQAHEARAVLAGAPVPISLPPVHYCRHYCLWADRPPPPAWFELRMADAPDETYTVWRTRRGGDFVIHDSSGLEIPKQNAAWRLSVGAFSRSVPPDAPESEWLLEVELERQHRAPSQERPASTEPQA